MKFTANAVLFALVVLAQQSTVALARDATWSDWEEVRDYLFDRIDGSTCPDEGDEALKTHWDYNYQEFVDAGMSEEEALQQDCDLFHRFRNPAPLGSRLIRHIFHDATGGFNGWLNIHDKVENPALDATLEVLEDDYFNNPVVLSDGTLISDVITFADFTAWAGHAAVLKAVKSQSTTDDKLTGGLRPISDDDIYIEVRVGRPTYRPTSDTDHGPTEYFPTGLGPQGSGQLITEYFATEFGFDAEQTVTIMGAHTLGGGRKEDSGFSGMWTQSKGKFNNDYQMQLEFPLPLICNTPVDCEYFSVAQTDILADTSDKQTCVAGWEDRCFGWEQTMRNNQGIDGVPNKFQWQHSCDSNGDGCTHLMLNIDIGLFYDIEGYICTAEDEANGVVGTAGRTCVEGMIKSYPAGSSCNQNNARVLASCFEANTETQSYLLEDSSDMLTWVHEFGPLFDQLTTHKMMEGKTVDDLTVLTPPDDYCNGDDMTWTVTIKGNERNCNYIGQQDLETRCSLLGNDQSTLASEACCETCADVTTSGEAACVNDMTWIATINGNARNCNYIKNDLAGRCTMIGDDGSTPAYEACCECVEYSPDRGSKIDGEEDGYNGASTIYESDWGSRLGSAAAPVGQNISLIASAMAALAVVTQFCLVF